MTDFFNQKVTIYNDIPSDGVNARRFDRFVIDLCNIQGGIVSKADGTVENIVNAITVISKDVDRYKTPLEYAMLPFMVGDLQVGGYEPLGNGEYKRCFTANVNDFVVLAEVDDVVTTSREFADLQKKYKDNGIVVRSVSVNIHGMSVDNVTITNVG